MLEIKLLPGSEVEITGEISADDFESCRDQALKEIKVLIENIGEQEILEKMAIIALQKEYLKIIEKHKIKAIGRPLITITKIAVNNPLGFKIKTFVMPEIELPDYKKISQEIITKLKTEPQEKRRLEILKKIADLTKADIPKILLEAEGGDLTRVKYNLILNEIAEKEKIEVSEEEVNKELDQERIKVYIYGIIRNEKVFRLLESC